MVTFDPLLVVLRLFLVYNSRNIYQTGSKTSPSNRSRGVRSIGTLFGPAGKKFFGPSAQGDKLGGAGGTPPLKRNLTIYIYGTSKGYRSIGLDEICSNTVCLGHFGHYFLSYRQKSTKFQPFWYIITKFGLEVIF